jgi:hypothetical protein
LLLLYLLRLLKRAELRRHFHLGAAMQQVINGKYLDARLCNTVAVCYTGLE